MTRRSAIIFLQLAGGLLAFAAWAQLSSASAPTFAALNEILTLGMIIQLPLSLGLVAVLPNFFNEDRGVTGLVIARQIVHVLVIVAIAAQAIGVAGALLGFPTFLSAAYAGLVLSCSVLQQTSRLFNNLGTMTLAATYAPALPLAGLLSLLLGGDIGVTATLLLAMNAMTCALLAREVRVGRQVGDFMFSPRRVSLMPALRISLPLVPHLLAFAVIAQGLRVPATLSGTSAQLITSSVIMLFVGLAAAVIVAVNGVLTVDVQRASVTDVARRARRAGVLLAGLGGLGGVALPLAYAFGAQLFEGSIRLDLAGLGLLALVAPALCMYFFASSLLLRAHRSRTLALVTVPIAITYTVVGTAVTPDLTPPQQLALYVAALVVMSGLAISLAFSVPGSRRAKVHALAFSASAAPGLLLILGHVAISRA